MADKHIYFSVKRVGHKGFAIRYTPEPNRSKAHPLTFGIAFDVLIAGENLADKETSLTTIAGVLNQAIKAEDEVA